MIQGVRHRPPARVVTFGTILYVLHLRLESWLC